QVDDAGLGRVVRRGQHLGHHALDRRRRDDRAAAALEQGGQGGARAVEDAGEHHADALIPDGGVDVADVSAAGPGGVVVHDVEPAEALDGERDGRLEVAEHADVRVVMRGASTGGGDLGDERFAA